MLASARSAGSALTAEVSSAGPRSAHGEASALGRLKGEEIRASDAVFGLDEQISSLSAVTE